MNNAKHPWAYPEKDVFRVKALRETAQDERHLVGLVKAEAAGLLSILEAVQDAGGDTRCIATAKTKLEEAVMWAVKGITACALGALLLSSSPSRAGCLKEAPALEWSYQGLNAADGIETAYIIHSGKGHEGNPLLGKHPSDLKLAAVKVASGALHLGVTCAIGESQGYHSKWMMGWQVGTNLLQGAVVGINLKLALGHRK